MMDETVNTGNTLTSRDCKSFSRLVVMVITRDEAAAAAASATGCQRRDQVE